MSASGTRVYHVRRFLPGATGINTINVYHPIRFAAEITTESDPFVACTIASAGEDDNRMHAEAAFVTASEPRVDATIHEPAIVSNRLDLGLELPAERECRMDAHAALLEDEIHRVDATCKHVVADTDNHMGVESHAAHDDANRVEARAQTPANESNKLTLESHLAPDPVCRVDAAVKFAEVSAPRITAAAHTNAHESNRLELDAHFDRAQTFAITAAAIPGRLVADSRLEASAQTTAALEADFNISASAKAGESTVDARMAANVQVSADPTGLISAGAIVANTADLRMEASVS